MKQANNVDIYVIKCPVTSQVKYVGKTIDPAQRFRKHLTYKKLTTKCSRWIKGLLNKGLKPSFEIIDTVSVDRWVNAERAYILLFKSIGANLLNQLPGGEGGATMMGKKLTAIQKSKITASKIGKPNKYTASNNILYKGCRVSQYDLSGNFITTHNSIREAAKSINRNSRRIQMMLSGKGKRVNHVAGFIFKYAA